MVKTGGKLSQLGRGNHRGQQKGGDKGYNLKPWQGSIHGGCGNQGWTKSDVLDLFDGKENAKLPTFCSRISYPHTVVTDTLYFN